MPLPRKAVIGLMVDNLMKRGSVLPLSRRRATAWARGLDIPEGGETVLYTGHMYQLMPIIAYMAKRLAALENSRITRLMGLGRLANRVVGLSHFMIGVKKSDRQAADRTLRSIAGLLRAAGVEFGYLYGRELYSGTLVYDQGVDDVLAVHAARVRDSLREAGVKRLITVDPHTTHMLRHVYPKVLGDFPVDVHSYLEVLSEKGLPLRHALGRSIVVHDSCVYARYEDTIDQPRKLLLEAGAAVKEPRMTRRQTHCCGGPIESLFPSRAHDIASKRAEQLSGFGCPVATMCPICLVNLRDSANGNGPAFRDIADILAEAFLEGPEFPVAE